MDTNTLHTLVVYASWALGALVLLAILLLAAMVIFAPKNKIGATKKAPAPKTTVSPAPGTTAVATTTTPTPAAPPAPPAKAQPQTNWMPAIVIIVVIAAVSWVLSETDPRWAGGSRTVVQPSRITVENALPEQLTGKAFFFKEGEDNHYSQNDVRRVVTLEEDNFYVVFDDNRGDPWVWRKIGSEGTWTDQGTKGTIASLHHSDGRRHWYGTVLLPRESQKPVSFDIWFEVKTE